MANEATCKTCPWWLDFAPEPRGECRRRAPVAGGGMAGKLPVWPDTCETQSCGEHPDRQTLETKVRRLQVQPGDLVVVETRDHLNQEQRASLIRRWGETSPGTRAVVLDGGLHLASVLASGGPVRDGRTYVVGEQPLEDGHELKLPEVAVEPGAYVRGETGPEIVIDVSSLDPKAFRAALERTEVHGAKPSAIRED